MALNARANWPTSSTDSTRTRCFRSPAPIRRAAAVNASIGWSSRRDNTAVAAKATAAATIAAIASERWIEPSVPSTRSSSTTSTWVCGSCVTKRFSSTVATRLDSRANVPTAMPTTSTAIANSRWRRLRNIRRLHELVPDAIDRHDPRRLRRIGLELLAQVLHVHVHGAVQAVVIGAERAFEQLGAREHPARPTHEGLQQPELGRGQRHPLLRAPHHAALQV